MSTKTRQPASASKVSTGHSASSAGFIPTRKEGFSLLRQASWSAQSGEMRPQARFAVGPVNDAFENEADRIADRVVAGNSPSRVRTTAIAVQRSNTGHAASLQQAPASVGRTLARQGQPLEPPVRRDMEQNFGHDFSRVRVHTGALAEQSAREMGAHAYTVGRDVVFNAGQYAPQTQSGKHLLAHELTHVLQQSGQAGRTVQREVAPDSGTSATASTTPQPPRQDYVFIMGQDTAGSSNRFYEVAERYFRAHLPGATFVTDVRNLNDLLGYVANNIQLPIGNLYIVSHANEDGTLAFGLDSADPDAHMTVRELRDALHPSGGGASTLTSLTTQIDASTRIHIKGCDLGRTREMVELLDEAFGGAGTVTAPTHEQGYNFDPTLERGARRDFRAGIEASHPMPPPVDSSLRGRARRDADAARRRAVGERGAAVQAEITSRSSEEDVLAERAGTVESLSGPMFQRPGTTLYGATELRPEVDRLYSHLSETQRARMVTRLVARDRRSERVANRDGVVGQRGQRAYRHTPYTYTFTEPASATEANRAYVDDFRDNNFTARRLLPPATTAGAGSIDFVFTVEGSISHGRRQPVEAATRRYTSSRPDDASLIRQGRPQLNNPDRYAWRVRRTHASSGITTLSVIAERVIAYLHHGSLNPSAHDYFTRPESDPNFYATSTFAPPPPSPPSTGAGSP